MEKLQAELMELHEQFKRKEISEQQYAQGFVNIVKTSRELRDPEVVHSVIIKICEPE